MEKATKKKNPKYAEMVVEAFKKLDSRSGVSRVSIVNYIMANNEFVNKVNANKYVTKLLNEGVESGQYIQLRGTGANGSFKLSDQLKKEARAEKDKAARAEKRAEKAALKREEEKPAKKATPKKAATKSAAANKSKVDIRKSGVSFKKINTKKLQMAAKLVKENKMDKPKKGEKLHVSILIKPKAKKAPKSKRAETIPGKLDPSKFYCFAILFDFRFRILKKLNKQQHLKQLRNLKSLKKMKKMKNL